MDFAYGPRRATTGMIAARSSALASRTRSCAAPNGHRFAALACHTISVTARPTMKLIHSKNRTGTRPDPAVAGILREVSPESLRRFVEMLAFPRHYLAEHRANCRARNLLLKRARSMGYTPILQGSYDIIVMVSDGSVKRTLFPAWSPLRFRAGNARRGR